MVSREVQEARQREKAKENIFAKVVNLRKANLKGLAFENRRRWVQAFSLPGQPNDTGRPETTLIIEPGPMFTQVELAAFASE